MNAAGSELNACTTVLEYASLAIKSFVAFLWTPPPRFAVLTPLSLATKAQLGRTKERAISFYLDGALTISEILAHIARFRGRL